MLRQDICRSACPCGAHAAPESTRTPTSCILLLTHLPFPLLFKTPERIYFSSFALPFFLFFYDELSPRLAPRTGAAPQLPAAHPGTFPRLQPPL